MVQRSPLRSGAHLGVRLGILAVALLALAACGRKGPLELPPGAPNAAQTSTSPAAQAAADQAAAERAAVDPAAPLNDNPGLLQPPNKFVDVPADTKMRRQVAAKPKPINAPPAPSEKPFLLDPLIQ